MNELASPLMIDITCLCTSALLLAKFGRISLMHPAPTYLLFHFFECTQRLALLAFGAPPSGLFARQPLTPAELAKAVYCFDAALASVTAAWLIVSHYDYKKQGRLPTAENCPRPDIVPKYFLYVTAIILPLGIIGTLQDLHGAHALGAGDLNVAGNSRIHTTWDTSFASTMIQAWLGISFIPLFYLYGPKWRILAPFCVAALAIFATGEDRWRLMLPLIFICFAYMARQGRRWPRPGLAIVLGLGALLWLPGKQIGQELISGKSPDMATAVMSGVSNWMTTAASSDDEDTQFLDITAAYIAATDRMNVYFYGDTIADGFLEFIPRPLWAGKPMTAEWEAELSTPARPLYTYGATASLPGASYVDFGIVGVVVVPFAFAYFIGSAYFRSFRKNYFSVARFVYLVYSCSLLQVYRDGVSSFFVFNYINLWPLMAIVAIHYFLRPRVPKTTARPLIANQPG